jgi:uncharacterized membrane protein
MDNTIHEKINELTRRINELARQQTGISQQLVQLIDELEALKKQVSTTGITVAEEPKPVTASTVDTNIVIEAPTHKAAAPEPPTQNTPVSTAARTRQPNTTFEEFIGKNVASKVGILVTIIGIFIGARYAIEHNLVSPAVRVINGYISGIVLAAIAIRLKKKYEAYSAVLMGGGLAVLYFITFIAYGKYELLPQVPAFGLMLVCTAATVYTALWYNRVIIAHLGQIGAYAIPFLLSDNSGRYAVLFAYIAIINIGILIISFRKYWKSLFFSAFGLTWLIYLSWYLFISQSPKHNTLAWTYLVIFFMIFYVTFLAYKLIKKEQYNLSDVIVLLVNAFAFYGIGYGLLNDNANNHSFAGLFTLTNAAIHLVVSQVIRRLQLADRSLYYLVLGLVIVFMTIAVPVQFDGNWVTLLWTAEALLVFIIGRTRQAGTYEKLGTGLALLGFISLLQDWIFHSGQFLVRGENAVYPFANIIFFTGLLAAAAQGTMLYFNRNKKYQSALPAGNIFRLFYDFVLPVLFLVTCYFVFDLEINGYFRQLDQYIHGADGSFGVWSGEVDAFSFITQFTYTMVFVGAVTIINQRWVRNIILAGCTLIAIVLLLFVLIIQGWVVLNDLAVNYYQHSGAGLYFGSLNILMRYIIMAIAVALLFAGRKTVYDLLPQPDIKRTWSLVIHTFILSLLSAEYLCWTTASGAGNQFKLGLSIVWGIYALLLIVLGIRHKMKHLRLAAIVLFLINLIKLFMYDLAGSGTITKTISFISLGVILLLVSFLYNKYKDVLFGDEEA